MSKVSSHIQAMSDMGSVITTYVSGQLYFSGLHDTPTDYQGHSGEYLVVTDNESGLHFTGIEKIAQDLTDYGFGGSEVSNNFTGLQDTPKEYDNGAYVRSTTNGLEYAGIIPTSYVDVLSLPSNPRQHEGEIVKVGCDIYLSCNGEWQKLDTSNQDNIPSFYPACVTTTEEMIQYDKYEQEISDELSEQELINSINGIETNIDLNNVCLFQQEQYSNIILEEGTQWVNRGSISNVNFNELQTFGTVHPDKNTFVQMTSNNIEIETIDPLTQTIIKSQTVQRANTVAPNGYCMTSDFQYLLYLEGTSNDVYLEIKVMKYNESTGNFELDSIINKDQPAFSTWASSAFDHRQLERVVITEGGQKILMAKKVNPISGISQTNIVCLQKNGANWELANIFSPLGPYDTFWPRFVSFSEDGKYIMFLERGTSEYKDTIHFWELNYENSTTSVLFPEIRDVMALDPNKTLLEINNSFNTLIMQIDGGGGRTWQSIYKYDQSINSWKGTNTGKNYYINGMPILRNPNWFNQAWHAIFSEDGNIMAVSIGCDSGDNVGVECGLFVYYYNSTIDEWNLMSYGDYGSINFYNGNSLSLLMSADGKQVVGPLGTVHDINFTTIPRTNNSIYNNSVYIDESAYKWGIFDGPTNINLNGTIDPDCTFVEWKSSNTTIVDSAALNTAASINNHTSITGVFNCG